MAIYHFSVKNISRSDGRSAVACAAYRSGEKLEDLYQGKIQDYTKKTGVEYAEIYAPENTNNTLLNRQNLWNEVEKIERRKDAILAREFEIAFPFEFDAKQRKEFLDEFCIQIVKKYNVIVDAAIHSPHTASGSDERNFHAHIMFTARAIDLENGAFSKKKYRDFNREIREEIIDGQKVKKVVGVETVKLWRKSFADLTNQHLEANDINSRIDHRSYKDQGSELEATKHEGIAVTALRRKYDLEQKKPFFERNIEIVMPDIAIENEKVKQLNAEISKKNGFIQGLDQEILLSEETIKNLKAQIQEIEENIQNEPSHEETSDKYFTEVFHAILKAKRLKLDVQHFNNDHENDYSSSVSTKRTSLNHKAYAAHKEMMDLAIRYSQHAEAHNFKSLRDRTINYLEDKKKQKKELGMMAFLTKPKELDKVNNSIEQITNLYNYFSSIGNDFKGNPFIKSIEADYFQKEQEIKKDRENKESSSKSFEAWKRREEHQRKILEEHEKRRFEESQLQYKKEVEEYRARKAEKVLQKLEEQPKKEADRNDDFQIGP